MLITKYFFNIFFPLLNQKRELNTVLKKYRIESREFFVEKLPIVDYEYLKTNYFYNQTETCDFYVRSSGTSTEPKNIPVTLSYIKSNHIYTAKLALIHMIFRFGWIKMLYGKNLALTGYKYNEKYRDKEVYDISALIFLKRPAIFKKFGYPDKIFNNWDEKLKYFLAYEKFDEVKSVSGVPTWMISLFDKLSKDKQLPFDRIFRQLEYVIHGGVSFLPYFKIFNEIFKQKKLSFFEIFNSTEGFYAFQFTPLKQHLLLCTNNNIYYEFKHDQEVVDLSQIEINKEYELIISNCEGLLRYNTYDKIVFHKKNPCLISFVGRTSEYLNAFGEDLSLKQTDDTINVINNTFNLNICEYLVWPKFSDQNGLGYHEWALFTDRNDLSKDEIVRIIDENLKNINSNYNQKRYKSLALLKPSLIFLPTRLMEEILDLSNKNPGGQAKIKKLHNDRNIFNIINQLT